MASNCCDRFLLFISLISILLIVGNNSLQCLRCDSSDSSNEGCDQNKNFSSIPVEDCPTEVPSWFGEIYCARMTVKVMEEDIDSKNFVVRGCMPKVSCEIMKINNVQKDRNFTVTECYVCKTNLCNNKRRYKRGRLIQLGDQKT